MCGIAGIFNLQGREMHQADALNKMTNRMRHRGPDDEGFLLAKKGSVFHTYAGNDTPKIIAERSQINVPEYPMDHINKAYNESSFLALGHRRLSIVDLSPHGHQPMCTYDRRYWVVYNGEIYNFREIANELKSEGVHLHSHSDTEVLLNAYATWGESCLQKFNGMFAFALWDNRNKTLFCARDRIGIKPFYYTIQYGQFIFASDIKTLIASGLYTPEPDMEGLYLSMAFGIAPRPKTAFKDVFALEQAHWMRLHADGRIEKQRYWSIPVGTQCHSMTEKEAVELLEERLTTSIRYRLVADVPVGTFMSGGIDSTTISSIASKLHPGIKAFTLAYKDTAPELDEVSQAKATARMNQLEHIIMRADPDESLLDLESWIDGYEEPFYSLAANHVISKLVKENNVTVVLNGLGGDELFAGYSYYTQIRRWRLLMKLRPAIKIFSPLLGMNGKKIFELSSVKSADRFHTIMRSLSVDSIRQSLFNVKDLRELNTVEYVHKLYADGLEFTDDIEALSYMDLMNYIGNHHVHRVDQFTMMCSLEGRFPFLDHNLVEAAFRIPSRLKIKGRVQKYILRKVAEKYIAPECLSMKKKGFGLPLKQWMRGPLKPLVGKKICNLKQRPFIQEDTVERWQQDYATGKLSFQKIWHLVALEMWYERFIEKKNVC